MSFLLLCSQQAKTFEAWNTKEKSELEAMQKEEIRQREIESVSKVVPIYKIGDYVTCQFKRIGGAKYNGTVTHLYTLAQAEELQIQLDEASSKLLKIFKMVDKRLISRIQAIEVAIKKKEEEISPQMANQDDSIALRLRTLEPDLEAQKGELSTQQEAELALAQQVSL